MSRYVNESKNQGGCIMKLKVKGDKILVKVATDEEVEAEIIEEIAEDVAEEIEASAE